MATFLQRLGVRLPLIQAPMAGVSTPALAAAVSNAGGLGSIGIGASSLADARQMVRETRALTERPFLVNVFCHRPPLADPTAEAHWLALLRSFFGRYDAESPAALRTIYTSFADDAAVASMLVEEGVPAVSFHFGLPRQAIIDDLKRAGTLLLATATSVDEARAIEAAGIDVLVAQGFEAGGHRGVFDPDAPDDQLRMTALLRLLVEHTRLPVVAAGGVMDGSGIADVLAQGAVAAQLGTAFVACPESAADDAYRAGLTTGFGTRMVDLISGRPARTLVNRWTALADALGDGARPPAYPIAYDAGKALHAAAKAKGEFGWGAQWAGEGAPKARAMPAADLVAVLAKELEEAQAGAS